MRKQREEELVCPECGLGNLRKLISRVSFHVSEKDRIASYDPDSNKDDSFYKDTRNIGVEAKKKAMRMGIDLGTEFEDKLEKLRSNPGSVIKDND